MLLIPILFSYSYSLSVNTFIFEIIIAQKNLFVNFNAITYIIVTSSRKCSFFSDIIKSENEKEKQYVSYKT